MYSKSCDNQVCARSRSIVVTIHRHCREPGIRRSSSSAAPIKSIGVRNIQTRSSSRVKSVEKLSSRIVTANATLNCRLTSQRTSHPQHRDHKPAAHEKSKQVRHAHIPILPARLRIIIASKAIECAAQAMMLQPVIANKMRKQMIIVHAAIARSLHARMARADL